jgi:hypothetical protein
MNQTAPPCTPREYIPTKCDLPSENLEEPGLSHELQSIATKARLWVNA